MAKQYFAISMQRVKEDYIAFCNKRDADFFNCFNWFADIKSNSNEITLKTVVPKSIIYNNNISEEIKKRLKPYIGKSVRAHILLFKVILNLDYNYRTDVLVPVDGNWMNISRSNWMIISKSIYLRILNEKQLDETIKKEMDDKRKELNIAAKNFEKPVKEKTKKPAINFSTILTSQDDIYSSPNQKKFDNVNWIKKGVNVL